MNKLMIVAAMAALVGCATSEKCSNVRMSECSNEGERCKGKCAYPEHIEEGFVSLFDGDTFLTFEGDVKNFTVEKNPIIGYMGRGKNRRPFRSDVNAIVFKGAADGKPKTIWTRTEYDNFVLRFGYCVTTNGEAGVGLRTPVNVCPCKGGVAIALADDFSFHGTAHPADHFSGSLIGLKASRREHNERLDWKHETGETYAKPTDVWNFVEVRAIGGNVKVFLNGELVSEADVSAKNAKGRICFTGLSKETKWFRPRVKRVCAKWRPDGCPCLNKAPEGFTSLFDGKTLSDWKGVTEEEEFDIPFVRERATPEKRAQMQAKADELMRKFWRVRDGVMFFDGKKGGYSLATKKDYKDFEMYVDWRLLSVCGDSGLYVRGMPQVQIWDAHDMWHLGSGGLYNNAKYPRHGLEIADNPAGDWNRFYIRMVGDRVTVRLNGKVMVEDIPLENLCYKKFPGPIPVCEQIELQCHGDPLEFRNVFIREL